MTGFEAFIWVAFMCAAATPFLMIAWEQDKVAKKQDELLKEQLEINRRWDVMIEHARRLNKRISEIHRGSDDL